MYVERQLPTIGVLTLQPAQRRRRAMMKKNMKRIIGLLFGVAFLLSITFPALAAYSHFETGVVSETGFYVGASGTEVEVIDENGTLIIDGVELTATATELNAISLFGYSSFTAGEAVEANRVVYFNTVTEATYKTDENSAVALGVNISGAVDEDDDIYVGIGLATVVADQEIEAGNLIKTAADGRVISLVTSDLSGDTMGSGTGGNFANQPANDAVELVSSEAADTTQQVTIYGTTNGGDGTVVTETVTLTGDTPVATTKDDWGVILGVELAEEAAGTVTIREGSEDQTITTITTGNLTAGILEVEDEIRAFNQKPTIVADDATTKSFSVIGTDEDHAALTEKATALTGASAVTLANKYNTITRILVGDVESARTVTLKVGALDATNLKIGKAIEAAAEINDEILALITP
jgi:microcystin-dependent protein